MLDGFASSISPVRFGHVLPGHLPRARDPWPLLAMFLGPRPTGLDTRSLRGDPGWTPCCTFGFLSPVNTGPAGLMLLCTSVCPRVRGTEHSAGRQGAGLQPAWPFKNIPSASLRHALLSGPRSRAEGGPSEDEGGVWNQPAPTLMLLAALNLGLLIREAEGDSNRAHPTGIQGLNDSSIKRKGFYSFDKPCEVALHAS